MAATTLQQAPLLVSSNFTLLDTLGIDLCNLDIIVENIAIKARLWDTAGQERYQMLNRSFYKGSFGAMVVLDLTREIVKNDVEKWIKEIRQETKEDTCIMIIGNKTDLNINPESSFFLRDYCTSNNYRYFETSARKNVNIDVAFETLFTDIKRKYFDGKVAENSNYSFRLKDSTSKPMENENGCKC